MAVAPRGAGDSQPMSQERLLLNFIERLDRHLEGRVSIHIQLSKLKPANRKEMHIRIADDTFRQLVKKYEVRYYPKIGR